VVVLNRGRIEDMGPPDKVYTAPRTAFTAAFMGESNALDGRVLRKEGGRTLVDTAVGVLVFNGDWSGAGDPRVMFRPEKVAVLADATAGDRPRLSITGRSFQGSHLKLWARGADGTEILLKLPEAGHLADGTPIAVDVPPDAVLLYPREAA
jgi:spermidine/putrescine transport system ATP-binding protein